MLTLRVSHNTILFHNIQEDVKPTLEKVFVNITQKPTPMPTPFGVVEALLLELRAHQIEVRVVFPSCSILKHGCGAIYSPEDWYALPAHRTDARTACGTLPSWYESRQCTCGEALTLANLIAHCIGHEAMGSA